MLNVLLLTCKNHLCVCAVGFLRVVIFCGVGEGRGVFNDSGGELEMFKVGVTLLNNEDQDPTDPKLDTITEMGDDLSSR